MPFRKTVIIIVIIIILLHIFLWYKNNFTASRKSLDNTFRKIVLLAKLLLCKMSSSMVSKVKGAQTRRNIYHFSGGQNLFRMKRTFTEQR